VTQSPVGDVLPPRQPARSVPGSSQHTDHQPALGNASRVFRVEGVSYTYPHAATTRPAVAEVSFEVEQGAIVGILGPNGSGKTTLLHLLAGLLQPQSGRILSEGAPISELSPRARAQRVAVVPQTTVSAFGFTALDLVLMGRYPHLGPLTLEGPADLAIARAALAATDTSHLEARPFGTLSGGERQRVVIASALAQASSAMLLDEPTASLDLGHQLELAALIDRLNRDRGTTFVVSTHDINLAASLCTHVALLLDGRLHAYGPTLDIISVEAIRTLYGIDADVQYHTGTRRLTVVPLARTR
jgi:iron complex transport system ATP-binding protein